MPPFLSAQTYNSCEFSIVLKHTSSFSSASMETWWWWWLKWVVVVIIVGTLFSKPVAADPQINLLNKGCSQYNASNVQDFFNNLNATFTDLRNQLTQGKKLFATAQEARSSDPTYAMVQCRNYLSNADCVACYDAAVSLIRNCSAGNGARVIYDGCFLRYESNNFYNQTTLPGNVQICGNKTASQASVFQADTQTLLQDLELATPRINGFYAASTKQVTGGSGTIYGVAQCAETITSQGCQDCLTVAYGNIHSCLPIADGSAIDAACFMRYSTTPFFADNQTINITPFLSIGGGGDGSSKKKAIIGGVVGGGGLLLIIVALLLLWYRFYRKTKARDIGSILGATELQGPANYRYNDLKLATKDFSKEYKLGEGGFGEVFKGILPNGNVVAVKRITLSPGRAKEEFDGEVRLISNVHHRNLVRLLGCARKGAELLLVHEYMSNGSLDRYLYGDKKGTLNWKQRFNIIFATARGLAYLHEQFHVIIIHRDIKPSNILLDDDFQPKIADFGLAKLLPGDQSHVNTKFAGTLGYTAPEYALQGRLSEKVDTYSFGVVVLEIISGKRSNDIAVEVEPVSDYLLEQAWRLHESNMHMELVDHTLDPNEYDAEEVKKVMEIALLCTQSQPSSRPTMSEVVVMLLSGFPTELRTPVRTPFDPQRAFVTNKNTSTDTKSSNSNATASFTEFTGR